MRPDAANCPRTLYGEAKIVVGGGAYFGESAAMGLLPPMPSFRHRTVAEAARAYMRAAPQAQPADLPLLLESAGLTLRQAFRFTPAAEIEAAALAAWAEVEGERTRCYVDLEASTPHLLYLVDPVAGVRRPIPVADLVRILGPRMATPG